MSKPKILISMNNGILTVEAASTDVEIYVIDMDELEIKAGEGKVEEYSHLIHKDMRNPIETVRGNFSSFIEDFIDNVK